MTKSKRKKKSNTKEVVRDYINVYEDNTFNFTISFCIGKPLKTFKEFYEAVTGTKEEWSKYYDADGLTFMIKEEGQAVLFVWTRKKDWSVIAHECLHATNYALNNIGYKLDLRNDEVQAYLLSKLMEEAGK